MPQRYTLHGHGKQKVVVGHTWFADHSTFDPMLPYLDSEAFTYAFLDYRGYGASAGVAGEYTIAEMGRDMVACADALHWERFHLLGNSMGGQASQWVAGHYPERVRSVALLSSVPAEGMPLTGDPLALFQSAGANPAARQQIVSAVTGGRYSMSFARHLTALSERTASRATIEAYLRAWMSDPGTQSPSAFSGPVHAYVGQFDPVLTLDVATRSIKRHLPQAVVKEIPGCGHFAPIEVPAFTASAVESFFDTQVD